MGQNTDQSITDDVLRMIEAYPEIAAVQNLMVHDYGFGYFVISLRIEGYRKDSEQLYNAIHEISCTLYQQFHCDSFIQVDYLIDHAYLTNSRNFLNGGELRGDTNYFRSKTMRNL